MLFLAQKRHDGAHCPGYLPELLPARVEAQERRHEIVAPVGMKPHGMYRTLPEHWEAATVEAGAPGQIAALSK